MVYVVITVLAFFSGYAIALHSLSKRVSMDRFVVLERLFMATVDFYRAKDFETIEQHGARIHTLVKALGGKV